MLQDIRLIFRNGYTSRVDLILHAYKSGENQKGVGNIAHLK